MHFLLDLHHRHHLGSHRQILVCKSELINPMAEVQQPPQRDLFLQFSLQLQRYLNDAFPRLKSLHVFRSGRSGKASFSSSHLKSSAKRLLHNGKMRLVGGFVQTSSLPRPQLPLCYSFIIGTHL
mmetsp:Transcript_50704/g.108044  ORF Transcript_50704/g.108044 Transcript_50704/m.108044 type:complete len:124 (+) Transcript_50704:84-455(+)